MHHRTDRDIEYDLERMVEPLATLQRHLSRHDINSLIGGGVGLDLLGIKYIPYFEPRKHGDIDLYLPIVKRRQTENLIRGLGFEIYNPYNSVDHFKAYLSERPYDFFWIDGSESHPFVRNASKVKQLVESQGIKAPTSNTDYFEISTEPCEVFYLGRVVYVLNVQSQASVRKSLASTRQRDRLILQQLEKITNGGRIIAGKASLVE